MDSSFNADRPGDDLSTAFGTETLAERDMVPEGFVNAAATFLNPTKRLAHFEKQWTGSLAR